MLNNIDKKINWVTGEIVSSRKLNAMVYDSISPVYQENIFWDGDISGKPLVVFPAEVFGDLDLYFYKASDNTYNKNDFINSFAVCNLIIHDGEETLTDYYGGGAVDGNVIIDSKNNDFGLGGTAEFLLVGIYCLIATKPGTIVFNDVQIGQIAETGTYFVKSIEENMELSLNSIIFNSFIWNGDIIGREVISNTISNDDYDFNLNYYQITGEIPEEAPDDIRILSYNKSISFWENTSLCANKIVGENCYAYVNTTIGINNNINGGVLVILNEESPWSINLFGEQLSGTNSSGVYFSIIIINDADEPIYATCGCDIVNNIKFIDNKHLNVGSSIGFGLNSMIEGFYCNSLGLGSHSEGFGTMASGWYSHSECQETIASGESSHAEGGFTTSSGDYSHAEGMGSKSIGYSSHAEGHYTIASEYYSHAEGQQAQANGYGSHAEGGFTKANSTFQHVQGCWNIPDNDNRYIDIVGNGEPGEPSNAETLDWNGNLWVASDIMCGGTGMDDATHKLSEKASLSDLSDVASSIPTKVSDLSNDSGFLNDVFFAGTTPPTNTKLLWIDTSSNASGLKYFNGSEWVAVPTFWM